MSATLLLTAALLAPTAPAVRAAPSAPALMTPGDETTVHLTKEEALAHVFPGAARVVEVKHVLTADDIAAIERLGRAEVHLGGYYLYAAWGPGAGDEPTAYATVMAEIGKTKPITHIVGVSPSGEAQRVAVMVYRESIGDEVSNDRFVEQYDGMTLDDAIRIERDIVNEAGATLSCHAMCRGVRQGLAAVRVLLLDVSPAERRAMLATGADVTPGGRGASTPTAAAVDDGVVRIERAVMGTPCVVELRLDGSGLSRADGEAAAQAALDEVARWDGVLSNWRDDTPLAELNRAPAGSVSIGRDLAAWLDDAARWHRATDGLFDPALGALVKAWRLDSSVPRRPLTFALRKARAASGFAHVQLDANGGTVTRDRDGVLLDPGGSGKGWALDRAAEVLRGRGVERALLSFRSTLLALGPPPGESGWSVPIVHDGRGEAVAHVSLAHGALSVSGGSLRAFRDKDVERGHVLDPRDGVPVPAARLSWVRHASAAAADALSTALLVAGPGLRRIDGADGGFLSDASSATTAWPAGSLAADGAY